MKNKGITLLVLMTTVVIMLILAGVTITTTRDFSKSANATKIFSVMKMIEARAETVIEDKIFEKEEINEITVSKNEYIVDSEDKIIYIKWGKDEIAHQGIDNSVIKDEEYFIIAYNKTQMEVEDIIYSTGCKLDDKIVYKMSEIKENM